MSFLGTTFEEKYTNFFKYFSNKHTKLEIKDFITKNRIPKYSNSYINNINLNIVDNQNLNILFHIIIKSESDLDCLEKLKFLIEEYDINYNLFDFIHHRKLPFYTCVKGFLESTKYLINKMNFDIDFKETDGKTLFFSAIKSYNIKLMEYLDNKFPNSIFIVDDKKNTCIFNIFKKDIKNLEKKEDIEKLKNVLRFILKRGFKIDEKNKEGISFREKCDFFGINNILNEVIQEFGGENKDKNKENENNNEKKEDIDKEMKNNEKINENNISNISEFKYELKLPNKIKSNIINNENKKEKNNEINLNKNNNFDFDIEMDDEFIKSESKRIMINSKLNIKEEKRNNFNKSQNCTTKKKVCAFLSKKRHNLIVNEENLKALRNNEIFKKFFILKN